MIAVLVALIGLVFCIAGFVQILSNNSDWLLFTSIGLSLTVMARVIN
jgi:hypothetical protein